MHKEIIYGELIPKAYYKGPWDGHREDGASFAYRGIAGGCSTGSENIDRSYGQIRKRQCSGNKRKECNQITGDECTGNCKKN